MLWITKKKFRALQQLKLCVWKCLSQYSTVSGHRASNSVLPRNNAVIPPISWHGRVRIRCGCPIGPSFCLISPSLIVLCDHDKRLRFFTCSSSTVFLLVNSVISLGSVLLAFFGQKARFYILRNIFQHILTIVLITNLILTSLMSIFVCVGGFDCSNSGGGRIVREQSPQCHHWNHNSGLSTSGDPVLYNQLANRIRK